MDRYNNRESRKIGYGKVVRKEGENRFTREKNEVNFNRPKRERPAREAGNSYQEDRKYVRRDYKAYSGNKPERKFQEGDRYERKFRNTEDSGRESYKKRPINGNRSESPVSGENAFGRKTYRRPVQGKEFPREKNFEKRRVIPFRKNETRDQNIEEKTKESLRLRHYSKKKQLAHRLKTEKENAELRLNRFISMSGVCSRRDADTLIKEGRVKVNGVLVDTVGIKVKKNDRVEVDGEIIIPEKKVYLVLNKPKDFVTTVDDPLERKTVMSLVQHACKERIYPVGRLDRQTTGVLLFTNDGDLSKKLTHPKYEHKKIYHVFLDKPLSPENMEKISQGIELEDGFIKADEVEYVSADQMEIGIEIHSGKNRIVRRIFEHLGYQIVKLDRVYFAGITKKNLPRSKWRFLTPEEIRILKAY